MLCSMTIPPSTSSVFSPQFSVLSRCVQNFHRGTFTDRQLCARCWILTTSRFVLPWRATTRGYQAYSLHSAPAVEHSMSTKTTSILSCLRQHSGQSVGTAAGSSGNIKKSFLPDSTVTNNAQVDKSCE